MSNTLWSLLCPCLSLAESFSRYWCAEDLKAVPCLLHNTSLILVSLVLLKPVPFACAVPGGPSPCWSPCSWPRRYRAPTRTRTGLGGSSLPEQIPQVFSLTQDRELCAQACPRPRRCIYSKKLVVSHVKLATLGSLVLPLLYHARMT